MVRAIHAVSPVSTVPGGDGAQSRSGAAVSGDASSSEPRVDDWDSAALPLNLKSTIDLTIRARAGDQEALEALCLRCLKALTCYAAGRLPPAVKGMIETQDIVLQAVQKGLSRLDEFDHRHQGALIAYMRRILKNLIIDHWRSSARKPLPVPLDDQQAATTRTPLECVLEREQIELYERALERVKSRDAELVRLRIDEQLGYEEIAVHLGLPSENAARVAVRRAVLRIAHEMSILSNGDSRKLSGDQP
jgi:RNA polymerase sigma factor (sigma-70 family)